MRTIPLTQGKVAIVDDEDYEWLSKWGWYAVKYYGTYYAARRSPRLQGKSTFIRMHRAILCAEPGEEIDHINHDGLDNRRCNLRLCSHAENQHNRRPQAGGTSRLKGVYWDEATRKWRPRIRVSGRRISLGYFDDEIDAAHAYDEAAIKYFGEFANINQIYEEVST